MKKRVSLSERIYQEMMELATKMVKEGVSPAMCGFFQLVAVRLEQMAEDLERIRMGVFFGVGAFIGILLIAVFRAITGG